MEGCYK